MEIQNIQQYRLSSPFCNRLSTVCHAIYAVVARITILAVDFFTRALSCMCCCLSLRERWVFRTVDPEVRSQLIIPEMELFYDRERIIEAIANLPAAERNSVAQNALLLMTPAIGTFYRVDIIEAIANLPAAERNDFAQNALLLMTPAIDGFDRLRLIRAITAVPAAERNDFAQNALLLMTPALDGFDRLRLIRAIAAVPAAERNSVAQNAALLINPHLLIHPHLLVFVVEMVIRALLRINSVERNDIVIYALQLINPALQGWDIEIKLDALREQPADQRDEYVRNQLVVMQAVAAPQNAIPALGVNVHEGNRDERVKTALHLLFEFQGAISEFEINQAVEAFVDYLYASSFHEKEKQLAIEALITPKREEESFGPLMGEADFSILGLMISGKDLIGRLWIFASQLTQIEQENAKRGMVAELTRSYNDDGTRVCNQGKTQRLVVAVLQGRLKGVNIEGEAISINREKAVAMFFNIEAHKRIDNKKDLLLAAEEFCKENPLVDREKFIEDIKEYAEHQQME